MDDMSALRLVACNLLFSLRAAAGEEITHLCLSSELNFTGYLWLGSKKEALYACTADTWGCESLLW